MKLLSPTKPLHLLSAAAVSFGLLHGLSLTGQVSLSETTMANAAPASPSEVMHAKVWLTPTDRKQLDDLAAGVYKEGSPTYHHFLKPSDLSRFYPSKADIETVKQDLIAKGLTVKPSKAQSMFLEVEGNVSTLEAAFQTEIKTVTVKGEAVHATTKQPTMNGASGQLVLAVTGLTGGKRKPDLVHPIDPNTNKAYPMVPMKSPAGIVFSSNCFTGVESHTFQAPGTVLPIAQYVGNRYGASITNTKPGTVPPCGYGAVNYSTAYGMQDAYKQGLNGAGQTIVIVDAYGSPTIQSDANAFSTLNGLPALSASNFQVLYPLGAPTATTAANAAGWAEETSLDVEWAHAMAPGATIVLLVAPSNSDADFSASVFYAIANGLGSVISNSYSGIEIEDLVYYPQELVISNLVSELGALLGISVNYSSGDSGDLEAAIGVKSVSDLGASPYATSVGGTSLAINANNTRQFETGWGNNLTKLASGNLAPLVPPLNDGFLFGAGGGESQFFRKPKWQAGLPGTGRQQPDISLDADPYTGVEFVVTVNGVQSIGVIGGTSLSCPTFSAVWAIANQRAGQIHGDGTLLGQAAPIVAKLAGTSAVNDVTPQGSPTNVAGLIFTGSGVTYYSPSELAEPLQSNRIFYSALYNSPYSGSWFDLVFGTDSSLRVKTGWDNVTGFGAPNGLAFIEAAAR